MWLIRIYFLFCGFSNILARDSASLSELHQELHRAELSLTKAAQKVAHLKETIAKKEIACIKNDVHELQQLIAEKVALNERLDQEDYFSGHRETLSRIIHSVPSCSTEAQFVLDQILSLITRLSDELVD